MRNIFLASLASSFGVALLVFALYPLFVWHFFYRPKIESQKIFLPLVQYEQEELGGVIKSRESTDIMDEFYLSVPRLGIEEAKVQVASTDFLSSLAHHPESVLPGEQGNVFITGHSMLPQFFNPKNYLGIFSTLHTLERGDEIVVSAPEEKRFRYIVIGMTVIDAKDTWIIRSPDKEGHYVSLLTCTPPGFTTQRLVVLGKQV